jgi:tRNA (guanine-N7-)-methyltransferase
MARLRKAGRVWQRPEARAAAHRVLFEPESGIFSVSPDTLFTREAPLEVEIGAGKGEFIVEHAAQFPERNFLAVELSAVVCRMLAVRCGKAGVLNLRVARMDARPLVNLMLPDASVAAYHIYFPDPWPKERHHKHRLFTTWTVASLRRTLAPGGKIYVATDVAEYAGDIEEMLSGAGFTRVSTEAPGGKSTSFARKFLSAGKAVFAGAFAVAEHKT